MPALDPVSEKAREFQLNLMKSGEAGVILDMLTKNNFLPNADETTKRFAYLTVLKLCKFLLTIMANVLKDWIDFNTLAMLNDDNQAAKHLPFPVLKQALHSVPNQNTEYMLRSVADKMGGIFVSEMVREISDIDKFHQLLLQAQMCGLPDVATIRAIIRLAWAASSGSLNHVNASTQVLQEMHQTNAREQRTLDNNDVLGMIEKYFIIHCFGDRHSIIFACGKAQVYSIVVRSYKLDNLFVNI